MILIQRPTVEATNILLPVNILKMAKMINNPKRMAFTIHI